MSAGFLASMSSNDLQIDLRFDLLWYNSSDGQECESNHQPSGPYIFRPNGLYSIAEPKKGVELEIVEGAVVSEARQRFSSWATLITRYVGKRLGLLFAFEKMAAWRLKSM
jgi:lysosomal alpha-mannosidase